LYIFAFASFPCRYVNDLAANVKASPARWKIVFAHHPLYTAGLHHGTLARCLRQQMYSYGCGPRVEAPGYGLEDVLVDSGAHAYFAGHEHVFQWHKARGVASFVAGASGGSDCGYYGGLDPRGDRPAWTDPASRHGFLAACVTAGMLTVHVVAADGEVLQVVRHAQESTDGPERPP